MKRPDTNASGMSPDHDHQDDLDEHSPGNAWPHDLVSFSHVRGRSPGTTQNRQPRAQTLLTYDGLSPTDLESVLETVAAHDRHRRPHKRRARGPEGRPGAVRPGWAALGAAARIDRANGFANNDAGPSRTRAD
jgi:hypothetical protein